MDKFKRKRGFSIVLLLISAPFFLSNPVDDLNKVLEKEISALKKENARFSQLELPSSLQPVLSRVKSEIPMTLGYALVAKEFGYSYLALELVLRARARLHSAFMMLDYNSAENKDEFFKKELKKAEQEVETDLVQARKNESFTAYNKAEVDLYTFKSSFYLTSTSRWYDLKASAQAILYLSRSRDSARNARLYSELKYTTEKKAECIIKETLLSELIDKKEQEMARIYSQAVVTGKIVDLNEPSAHIDLAKKMLSQGKKEAALVEFLFALEGMGSSSEEDVEALAALVPELKSKLSDISSKVDISIGQFFLERGEFSLAHYVKFKDPGSLSSAGAILKRVIPTYLNIIGG